MSELLCAIFKKNRRPHLKQFSWGPQTRHTHRHTHIHTRTYTHRHIHTQTHTHTDTHDDSIRRTTMCCISPKNCMDGKNEGRTITYENDRRMDGPIDGWTDKRTDGPAGERMDERTDGRTDKRTDWRTDVRTDKRTAHRPRDSRAETVENNPLIFPSNL